MGPFALHDASADYGGAPVIGPLSLTIRPGERVALVGERGAGKSTLIGLMYARWREHAALMPQDLGLVQTLSVFHNVYMGRLADNATWYNLATLVRPFRREVTAIRALLERLSIDDKVWAHAGELSGGQRQRTAVARALYQRGAVLLADEPVSALDGPQAEVVMGELARACPTSVIAMHDVERALRCTERVIGVRGGSIVLDEPSVSLRPQDLLSFY